MFASRILLVSGIIISFAGLSFFNTQNTLKELNNDKVATINLKSNYIKQKILKEDKLKFLSTQKNKDYKVLLNGKEYFFGDSYFVKWGKPTSQDLDGKETLILKDGISNSNPIQLIKSVKGPTHFFVTNYTDNITGSCNSGTYFDGKLLDSIREKAKEQKIDIYDMLDSGGNKLTLDQIKVQLSLNTNEGDLLTILLTNKKCFFQSSGKDLEDYIFLTPNFVLNTLKRRGAYLASKEIIDVRKDSYDGELLGYLYPRGKIENTFLEKIDPNAIENCVIGYSLIENCQIQ